MIMTKKEKLIEEYLAQPLKIGDKIIVMGLGSQNKKYWGNSTTVVDIIDGVPWIVEYRDRRAVTEQWKKTTYHIGTNPFIEDNYNIRSVNFQMESIIHSLYSDRDPYSIKGSPVYRCNINPFVFINGEKKYYQRPLVWTLEDKQLLIESIYNFIDCGKVLVRKRSWRELEELQKDGHELFFIDIVDGKQRLNAIHEFMNDKFKDSHGNLYSDLSDTAKSSFCNNQLISYSEIGEETQDKDILTQFLKLNFSGIPQSKEHLDYVRSLL